MPCKICKLLKEGIERRVEEDWNGDHWEEIGHKQKQRQIEEAVDSLIEKAFEKENDN